MPALTEKGGHRAAEDEETDEGDASQAEEDGEPQQRGATEVPPAPVAFAEAPDKLHDQADHRQREDEQGEKPFDGRQWFFGDFEIRHGGSPAGNLWGIVSAWRDNP